ncbi:hypothetical protein B0H15DRAFT_446523 [Mycena belliarum]|uniref:F-box domain-containing protein n=1 Tax=Mycena belliarum TaxID=1033014 RepID=A0AAD6U1Q7_9AGAR|nr:hypothetical protein B0H15DRAFT_446523 [Mycena belliae]
MGILSIPYPELLRSNTIPLDSQIPVILSAILAAEEDIRTTTENEVLAPGVKPRQDSPREFVRIHRSILSSLRRLPTEILSEIFMHCSDEEDGFKPRKYAAVCSRWRDVALSTPRLWCNVCLQDEKTAPRSLFSLLSLQLQRSGQGPLSVTFSDRHSNNNMILELLLAVSHRWRSLDLTITSSQQRCICRSPSHFPILKRLSIRVMSSFNLGNLSRPLPLLEELTLEARYDIRFKLPWTNFTKCTLVQCVPSQVLEVIRASSAIAELSLFECWTPAEPEATETPRTTNIRYLNISRCTAAFTRDFLGCAAFPNLQRLLLDDFVDTGHSVQLTSLLTGSSGTLTHLSLCNVGVPEHTLIALLRFTDAVDHVEISWPWDVHTYALIEALTVLPGKRPVLLPRLRILSVTGGLSCRDDDLLEMLQSRRPVLERVELFYAGRTFFFDRSLDGLREAGLEITVLLDGPVDPLPVKADDQATFPIWESDGLSD